MEPQCRPRLDTLHEIPDPRHSRGRRHPLAAILALMCVAMLCGYRSYSAIADWGRCYGQKRARALGFTHDKTPCAAPLHHVLRKLDVSLVEAALGTWAESVLTVLPPAAGELEAMAIDGKTLRGSRQQGAPAVHLLSALSHRLGLTMWQQAVADKTNEIPVLEAVLRGLLLEGRVLTVDALLTQRAIAQHIGEDGGDSVMSVKGNQPQLPQEIGVVFQDPTVVAETRTASETGRICERRACMATSSTWLAHDLGGVRPLERGILTRPDTPPGGRPRPSFRGGLDLRFQSLAGSCLPVAPAA